ncbi:RusA family crossover junction endodeoxyribonuclease (plasmid) [Rhizobium leguminosarum]|uniref:RusA family crossover junction endodeoxyribonuclease n=1 Tax=Rhizobium leguminosarum TaxID=384 RepID=UPI001031EFF3|nr:RusA family crossover junction endodeoxyribonuclease [Rhizobium leguminosarum]
MEPDLPFEFIIPGTPLSLQASGYSKETWKAHVAQCARSALPEGSWLLTDPLSITIYIFPDGQLAGDVDNRVKPILDGMNRCVYDDDALVERIVVQKFEPEKVFVFGSPSARLSEALDAAKPVTYIRITKDLHEELA